MKSSILFAGMFVFAAVIFVATTSDAVAQSGYPGTSRPQVGSYSPGGHGGYSHGGHGGYSHGGHGIPQPAHRYYPDYGRPPYGPFPPLRPSVNMYPPHHIPPCQIPMVHPIPPCHSHGGGISVKVGGIGVFIP